MRLKEILVSKEKGAAELLRDSVAWLTEHPDSLDETRVQYVLKILRTTRPSMVAFSVLADRIEKELREDINSPLAEIVQRIRKDLAASDRKLEVNFKELAAASAPCRIVTLSYSSSVLHCLRNASAHIAEVRVLRSEPGGEGRKTCKEIERFIKTKLCEDTEIAAAVMGADMGVIGADTVFADGAVLNKVLSAWLAQALRDQGKPFYVLATSWKRGPIPSARFKLSEDDAEVFEVVPAELITRVVAEE